MRRRMILFVLAMVLLSIMQCAPFSQKQVEPVRTIEKLFEPYLDNPALSIANVGVFIQDPKTREVLFQQNAHKLFMPASNQKVITTSAVLSYLGPDYRFVTKIYTDGTTDNGTLNGNIYIKGSGDPTLSGRFHEGDRLRDLENWADSLAERGITRINGDIITDANLFTDGRLGQGWAYDDLSYWYAAETSALSFNDNCIDVRIAPGDSVGAPPKLKYFPQTAYITMENDLVTVHEDSTTKFDYHREDGTNNMRFFGEISMSDEPFPDYITVHNPALYTATVFSEVLLANGISFQGNIGEIDYDHRVPDYDQMTSLVQYKSPPLSKIVEVINKKSQNFYAEQVLKTLGYERYGDGTFDGGIRAVEAFLGSNGVATEHMNVADGSGLSRRNLVSPFQMATVLRTMYSGKYKDVYLATLPIGGGDGTLSTRFKGTVAERRVRAKTGYVGFVRTLSGFVQTRDNEDIIFSVLVNHYTTNTSVINTFQDNIITLVAAHTKEELMAPVSMR